MDHEGWGKLDGAEGLRGVGVSWINRGEDEAEGVRGVVGFIGDEDWLTGFIIILSMSSWSFWKTNGYFYFTPE